MCHVSINIAKSPNPDQGKIGIWLREELHDKPYKT